MRILWPRRPRLDEVLAERLRQLIALPPTFGYRRLGALLRFAPGLKINRKAVYRVLRRKGWFVHPPPVTPRPRVHGLKRRAQRSAERWAMEVTHVPCGVDGGGHLTAVIDGHDREVTGVEFALRGRAKQAERALEEACLARFGTLRPAGPTPVVRRTTGCSARRVGCGRPVAITVCDRSSLRPTPRSRTGSSHVSFAVAKRKASGRTTSATSPKPALPLPRRSIGTTPGALIKLSDIAARASSAPCNPNSWLDSTGALHFFAN